MILGVKKSALLFLTIASKHTIQSFALDSVELVEVHPKAILLKIEGIPTAIRLMTSQGYEISLLFERYKKKG